LSGDLVLVLVLVLVGLVKRWRILVARVGIGVCRTRIVLVLAL